MEKRYVRFLSFLLVCVMMVGLLAACVPEDDTQSSTATGTAGTTSGGAVTPPTQEKEISSVTVNGVRVQLLSDTLVRIEGKMESGEFEDRASYIVQNRTDWEEVAYTQETVDGEQVIKTANYWVHIPEEASAEDVYITYPDGGALWDFSAGDTGSNVYLPSPSDELASWYFTDERIIPSSHGYSNDDIGQTLQGWDFSSKATDIFVFLPQGDYEQFCSDYVKLTGSTNMTTLQMLGYWDSRWYAYSDETALQQVQDYLDRGYSIDILVIDTDWRDNSNGTGYEINEDLFPNMKEFLEKCEQMGIDIVFNDHPEPKPGTSNGLDKDEVEYRNKNLTLLLSLGLEYWWYDRNWYTTVNSASPDISAYAFGMYAYQWITDEYYASITDIDEYAKRSLIMANVDGCLHGKWNYASDLSAHRYSIQWSGDIQSGSEDLAQEIYAAVMGGAEVGLPYISSDIGGHNEHVTNEQYIRWMQYGALSSICRVHCTNSSIIGDEGRMPWLFGEDAEEVTKTYVGMRYRLLPLYYDLARENYDKGMAIMRRLDMNYPDYPEASANDEYLLGDYILVAPIESAGADTTIPENQLWYIENGNVVTGLKAEYYSNSDWSGTPTKTKTDKNISFDWGTGSPAQLPSDYFSVKWSGNIRIGDHPAKLQFYADDYVKVYIDGKLVIDGVDYDTYYTTDLMAANSEHTIEVYYAEYSYDAHIYMLYLEESDESVVNSREVFIPDGTWIDVWTGERYVGPATYTVSHSLKTSPIFVREGALVTLAPDTQNTNSSNWSSTTLDVYPSINFDANTRLYEDDTKTIGYQDGQYRTTDITMTYDESKKAIVIKIGAAQGSFDGNLAFENRTWNIRIHTNPDWGNLNSAKLNGVGVNDLTLTTQDSKASPFAFSGGAADGDVYTFSFTGSVNEEYEIELYYESTTESKVNENYDRSEVKFDVTVEDTQATIDLTQDGIFDWISYGENNDEIYTGLEGGKVFTLASSYDTNWRVDDVFPIKQLKNGISYGGMASQKDFTFQINVEKAGYYTIYLGGNQATAKLTVRDRAGNVKTVYVGNINGKFRNSVVIAVTEDMVGTLYVTYSAMGTTRDDQQTKTYLSLYAVTASTAAPEKKDVQSGTTAMIESNENVKENVNLTTIGKRFGEETLDWMHFGSENGFDYIQKKHADAITDAYFQSAQAFYDYQVNLSYGDGQEITSNAGTKKGTASADNIKLRINVTEETKHIVLYTGVWLSTNVIEVYDGNGQLLAQSVPFSAGSNAVNREVKIAVDAAQEDTLTIVIRALDDSDGGNVSLAGVAVTGIAKQNDI